MENLIEKKIKYGSTLSINQLPDSLQNFAEFLKDHNSNYSTRTINNYTNALFQLIDIIQKEYGVDFDFGTNESLQSLYKLKEEQQFKYEYKVGNRPATNFKELNKLFSNNYSATIATYKNYLDCIENKFKHNTLVIKTKDKDTINSISKDDEIYVLEGIYQYQEKIMIGDIVTIVLIGSKSDDWDLGVKAIARIVEAPFDIGYEETKSKQKYYKIKVQNVLVLPRSLSKKDYSIFFEAIDLPFIGPYTKSEPNQAITFIGEIVQILTIIKGIIEYYPDRKNKLEEVYTPEMVHEAISTIHRVDQNYEDDSTLATSFDYSTFINTWEQQIYYGAPGTGKSYRVNIEYPSFKRITFYPEYSYFDFIGGLRPVQEEKIAYKFVPGSFTKELIEAYKNPKESHGIIIEEMNRSNVASVFGDIFQLLDRDNEGWSEYGITNEYLLDYLFEETGIEFDEVTLPPNFSLIGTMNSADQGVFVMDSAFKRRWQFKYIRIKFEDEEVSNSEVDGFGIEWKDLASTINNYLSEIGVEEDKLLGQRFLKPKELKDSEMVSSKLLFYLWDDVARYSRGLVFANDKRFDLVLSQFENGGIACFNEELENKLKNYIKVE